MIKQELDTINVLFILNGAKDAIFEYLDTIDLVSLGLTCKSVRNMVYTNVRYLAFSKFMNECPYVKVMRDEMVHHELITIDEEKRCIKRITKVGNDALVRWYNCDGNIDTQKFGLVMASLFSNTKIYPVQPNSNVELMFNIIKDQNNVTNLDFIVWAAVTTFIDEASLDLNRASTMAHYDWDHLAEHITSMFMQLRNKLHRKWRRYYYYDERFNRNIMVMMIISYHLSHAIITPQAFTASYPTLPDIGKWSPGKYGRIDQNPIVLEFVLFNEAYKLEAKDRADENKLSGLSIYDAIMNGNVRHIDLILSSGAEGVFILYRFIIQILYLRRHFHALIYVLIRYSKKLDARMQVLFKFMLRCGILNKDVSIERAECIMFKHATANTLDIWELSGIYIKDKASFALRCNQLN